jgi:hypothetical protein
MVINIEKPMKVLLHSAFISGFFLLSFITLPSALEAASPLHKATAKGNRLDVIQLILSGANINEQTKSGYTPLHIAAGLGHIKIVKILTIRGADVNIKDKRGRTPLDLAVLKNKKDVVRELDRPHNNIDAQKELNWALTFYGAIFGEGDWWRFNLGWEPSSNMVGSLSLEKCLISLSTLILNLRDRL